MSGSPAPGQPDIRFHLNGLPRCALHQVVDGGEDQEQLAVPGDPQGQMATVRAPYMARLGSVSPSISRTNGAPAYLSA